MDSLRLENIKNYIDSGTVEFAPITIFVGKNSCGKSSFIRFPMVLSQTFSSTGNSKMCLYDSKNGIIDYGDYEDITNKKTGGPIAFTAGCKIPPTEFLTILRGSTAGGAFRLADAVISSKSDIDRYEIIDKEKLFIDTDIKITYSNINGKLEIGEVDLFIDKRLVCSFERIDNSSNFLVTQKMGLCGYTLFELDYSFHISECDDPLFEKYLPHFPTEEAFPFVETDIATVISELPAEKKDLLSRIAHDKSLDGFVPWKFADMKESSADSDDFAADDNRKHLFYDDINKISLETIVAVLFYEQARGLLEFVIKQLSLDVQGGHYIGPIRQNPERIYRCSSTDKTENVGIFGENTTDVLYQSIKGSDSSSLADNLINRISDYLFQITGYTLTVDDLGHGFYQIILENQLTHIKTNIVDVGYGVSQVLPLVVQLAMVSRKSVWTQKSKHYFLRHEIYVFEQPELHLHPAAQSKLATIIAEASMKDPSSRILIETHSEHLIRALQVMIADSQSNLTKDMVRVYYIDSDPERGATVKEMKLTKYGQFEKRWPAGFFDEAATKAMELLKNIALQKSQGGNSDD